MHLAVAWNTTTFHRWLYGAAEMEKMTRDRADQRALELLKAWLSPDQARTFEETGIVRFNVRGSHSGKLYHVVRTHAYGIVEVDDNGVRVDAWCFVPTYDYVKGPLPIYDVMLAQKIALETDELAALRVANRQGEWNYTGDVGGG